MKSVTVAIVAIVIGFVSGRVSNSSSAEREIAENRSEDKGESQRGQKAKFAARSSDGEPAFSSVLRGLSHDDFESLAISALDSGNDIDGSAFLEVLITAWAQKDPEGALAFASKNDRPGLMFLALRELGAVDSEAALSWIKGNVKDLTAHGHLMVGVFQGVAKLNPEEAIQRIGDLSPGPQRDQILSVTIDEWAKNDIDSVFSWLEKAEYSQQTPYLYDQAVNRYIMSSPIDASALVSDMENGVEKSNFASNVAYQLAQLDPEHAVKWANSLSGEQKEFALNGLLENWAGKKEGAGEALDFILNNKDESNYEELFTKVTMKLSQSDPTELEQRLPSLSENEKELAAVQLAQVYSANVPEKAAQWLDTLDEGPVRDAALTSALNSFRNTDITRAFTLAETFSNAHTRTQEIQKVMHEWLGSDQAAAEKALQATSTISEDQKRIMLESLYRRVKPRNKLILPE